MSVGEGARSASHDPRILCGYFERSLDALAQAAVATDLDGLVCFWNDAAERMFGYTADEVLGRPVVDLVIPEQHRALARDRGAQLAVGDPYSGDWQVQDKSGRVFVVHVSAVALTADDGSVRGLLAMSYDVSARRAAERHAQRLAAIIEGSDDAIVETDLNGIVRTANAAVQKLYGYDPEELIGQPASVLAAEDRRDLVATAMATVAAGKPLGVLSTTRRHKDGSLFQISLRLSPVRDAAGAIVGVSGISRDVTADALNREALEASERRFRAGFEGVAMPQAMISLDGRFVTVNDAMCQLLRRDRSELEGATVSALRHASDQTRDDDPLARMFAGGHESGTVERVMRAPDGAPIPVLVNAALLRDAEGRPQEILTFVQGLSERLEAERGLRQSEARYRSIADTAQEGIWAADPDGRTLYANRKLCEIFGRSLEDVLASSVTEIFAASGPDVIAGKLRARQARGAEEYDVRYAHPDGEWRLLHVSACPLPTEDGSPIGGLAMITDITAASLAQEQLEYRALHDDLTGLANRTLLSDRLAEALKRRRRGGGPVAVLLADLDQFKFVNDSWGHAAGDQLLIQVAERLTAAVRPSDTVARFGGDEFVIVCEDTDTDQACLLAERLLAALAEPIDLGADRAYVDASIGIVISPPSDATDLLRFADIAMYAAKSQGRGRYQVFDTTLATRSSDRLELSRDLRDALTTDQLVLHYQPIIDLATGRLLSVEALARWTHPVRGPISPATFIEVAEASGLAVRLDTWVLRRACRDLRQLQAALGDSAHMSVNVSARHFGSGTALDETVLASLREAELSPDSLTLELTESALMDDPENARAILQRLRARGVTAAIDDFGTGFSSLSQLSLLPVSTLKIDRSFVERITDDPDSLAIVTSIIDMARAMGLTTVAEGIERPDQLGALRQLGCAAGQGYLWSPAVRLEDLLSVIRRLPDGQFPVSAARFSAA